MTSPAPLLAGPLYNTSGEETMSDDPEADTILTRFRAALGEIYGDRLEIAACPNPVILYQEGT